MKSITVGITGASGAIYARRLLVHLEESPEVGTINLVVSGPGRRVICAELEIDAAIEAEQLASKLLGYAHQKTIVYHPGDIGAPIASGSMYVDGMVIIPCSASTLGAIASGASRNLLHRAADVCLKESRPLVLVVRESPLSAIHLDNMLRLRNTGAIIAPAMPAFYHKPEDIVSLVDHFIYRILDHLGIGHSQETVWQGDEKNQP